MRAAAFQFDVRSGEVEANLAAVERGLAQSAERQVELVVLPEMWPTSFGTDGSERWVRASEEAVERVGVLSRELGLIVAGSALGAAGDGAKPRNRLTVFACGERVLVYDKLHLFSPTAEPESFSAGGALPTTVEVAGARLAGIVCYDLRFALSLRAPFLDSAEILVLPAQWPVARAVHWRALVCGRAAELQGFVVAANRTGTESVARRRLELVFGGNSLVAGPDGGVLAEGRGEEGLVVANLDLGLCRSLRRAVPVRKDERADLL